ncbi:MAG: 1-acyl-sn-glycerol-3-phosphate acyltransferase [Verrucomicrobiae bacterium]|nr:1-acyl-sn-glycerol-3-phosphate acyltransferase [Verrucomicrobiae bacterium]
MHPRQIAFWFFYGVAKGLAAPLLRLVFRMQVRGRERVPRAGGLLIVSNHISVFDPPILGSFIPRPVYWMAMVELFRHRIFGFLAPCMHCIPVDRQKGDSSAVRIAVRRLRAGDCVVIFPEGGVRNGETSALHGNGEFKGGAAAIALLARVPVLPVVLTNTLAAYNWRNWFFRRTSIRIEFGEPFLMDKLMTREQASDLLLNRMQQLAASLSKSSA